MSKSKIEFQYFNLESDGGTLLIKIRCNEEYLKVTMDKMKEEQEKNDYPYSDEELLQEILIKDGIEYQIINPIRLEW